MDTIRAVNSWDEEYEGPKNTDILRGECAKMYMDLRDIDVRLKDLKYRQARCRRIYSVCIIVAVLLVLIALMIGSIQLFYYRQPIDGFRAYIVNGGIMIGTLFAGISSVIFFSAMSVHSFWAQCANFLRIDKLEIQRLGCIREKSAIETRLANLEEEIEGYRKDSITEFE